MLPLATSLLLGALLTATPAGVADLSQPVKVERRHAEAAPAKQLGKLVTASRPSAKLLLDGKDTGRRTPISPAQPLELTAGPHTLTYIADDGTKATREVNILANETTKVVGVEDFK